MVGGGAGSGSGRVQILADTVADQIAAGEVVERPAAVVKELVENALDAGATTITIELEGGGKKSIAVSDDGSGMDRDDAVMAMDRHATSKIRTASDLIGVATYGFRGEALPAIASISKLELETAAATDNGTPVEATRLVVEGGRLKDVMPAARQRGTTVTVRRLFFNTPARRKFLRTQASETRAAVAAVSLLALARLDVAFKLTSDGRVLTDAPRVSRFADRITSLFGRSVAEGLIAVEHHAGPVSVRGFIQRPAEAKPSGRKAYLFVNGRPFRDPFLVRAAEAGYRATIHPGSRPTLFLSIGLPGDTVDVNVHPTKLEVRFRDRWLVERTMEEAVRQSLGDMGAAAVVHQAGASFSSSDQPVAGGGPQTASERGGYDAGASSLFGGAVPSHGGWGGVGLHRCAERGPVPADFQQLHRDANARRHGHSRSALRARASAVRADHEGVDRTRLPISTVVVTVDRGSRTGGTRSARAQRRHVAGDRLRSGRIWWAICGDTCGTESAPTFRCAQVFRGSGSRCRSWPVRRVGQPARTLRRNLRLQGGCQSGAAARESRASHAAEAAVCLRAAAARRARSPHHRAASQGRAGAPVWAQLSHSSP